ncbi:MAG: Holliday junction resolvase RuvX [Zetaproteobacteria bacterium CG12_big_fil_rev_8_21_14_0_65_54_13]|nr:MAG: Holliday junction resolvase RuvX [Zetaproteobacteria bacterium CG12_big_fil_rev_8_21_14_0_65_54_13]PIX54629.1 MAG: Holliday junction resolvase RuvX [Zetaproteobacteria bacterium CG_4_10_14_3_um_filter_54_28]PJA30683.1 MAG: Holliday junction resolvase RuvX [Zetaproteobacteria bacterium CG_4_9_14_3_um_filter_54_145]
MTDPSCSTTDPVTDTSRAEHPLPNQSPADNQLPPDFTLPLIALDIGMKRIGVAVCDRLGISCRGVTCLMRRDHGWPKQLAKLVSEYGAKSIVAGLPKNMDGTEGVQAADARAAVAELKKTLPLPVAFQDERLSTWTAKERLYAQGLREKKVLEKLDQTAAAVILEDFLATNPHLTGKPL